MTGDIERFDESWLTLREPADADARSPRLVDRLRGHLGRRSEALDLLDLGSGTGSTLRWLAPQLTGPQRWTLLDHNADLLAIAVSRCAGVRAADGEPVDVRTTTADLGGLSAENLAGTDVVTASALLDLLTHAQLDRLAASCTAVGCAALFTLSVAGAVSFEPADPLDARVAAAFDAHQQRDVGGVALLGPDAVAVARSAFEEHGYVVEVGSSPWRLGPDQTDLIRAWLDGWLAAAQEQDRGLAALLPAYREVRARDLAAGRLRVEIGHADVLALPRR